MVSFAQTNEFFLRKLQEASAGKTKKKALIGTSTSGPQVPAEYEKFWCKICPCFWGSFAMVQVVADGGPDPDQDCGDITIGLHINQHRVRVRRAWVADGRELSRCPVSA